MPKPGIIGFIGAMPVIIPRLGSKSAGKKNNTKQSTGKECDQEAVIVRGLPWSIRNMSSVQNNIFALELTAISYHCARYSTSFACVVRA